MYMFMFHLRDLKFIYCINGKRLTSGVYPPVTVLYRRGNAHYVQDGHTHTLSLDGRIETLRSTILHDDRKSLRRWFQSQQRYMELEASKILTATPGKLNFADRIRKLRIVAPHFVNLVSADETEIRKASAGEGA